jgi:hypothetical protein
VDKLGRMALAVAAGFLSVIFVGSLLVVLFLLRRFSCKG